MLHYFVYLGNSGPSRENVMSIVFLINVFAIFPFIINHICNKSSKNWMKLLLLLLTPTTHKLTEMFPWYQLLILSLWVFEEITATDAMTEDSDVSMCCQPLSIYEDESCNHRVWVTLKVPCFNRFKVIKYLMN